MTPGIRSSGCPPTALQDQQTGEMQKCDTKYVPGHLISAFGTKVVMGIMQHVWCQNIKGTVGFSTSDTSSKSFKKTDVDMTGMFMH